MKPRPDLANAKGGGDSSEPETNPSVKTPKTPPARKATKLGMPAVRVPGTQLGMQAVRVPGGQSGPGAGKAPRANHPPSSHPSNPSRAQDLDKTLDNSGRKAADTTLERPAATSTDKVRKKVVKKGNKHAKPGARAEKNAEKPLLDELESDGLASDDLEPGAAKDKDAESKPKVLSLMFSRVAFWQLICLFAATLVVSAWNFDDVREYVFEKLEYGRTNRAPNALVDGSDSVAASACIYLLEQGEAASYERVVEALYRRPQVAFRCLESAALTFGAPEMNEEGPISEGRPIDEDESADQDESAEEKDSADEALAGAAEGEEDGEASDSADPDAKTAKDDADSAWPEVPLSGSDSDKEVVPNYVLVASTLSQRWTDDLISGADNTCQTAYNTRRALELARIDPAYRLMSCAVGADSPEVRDCCVTQMGGHNAFVEMLGHPERAPLHLARYDYQALVGAAFPDVPLASELIGKYYQPWLRDSPKVVPTEAEAPHNEDAERFGDLQSDVQDWVVRVGCQLHFNQESRQFVPAAFMPLIEAPQCAPTSPPWEGMYSASSWSQMCMSLYDYRRRRDFTPREAVCDSLATATASYSIVNASFVIAGAVTNGRFVSGAEQKEIDFGEESNFGDRLFGFRESLPENKDDEGTDNWTMEVDDAPLGGF